MKLQELTLRMVRLPLIRPYVLSYRTFTEFEPIIIEARDFLQAIDTRAPMFPTFDDGLQVSRVVAAAFRSHAERRWVAVAEF